MSARWRERVGVAVFAGGVAGAAILGAPLRIRLQEADPSYYLSYVLDYRDVAGRYGQTYHGNRISYLLIDRAAFALLGPEVGYLAARWAVLAVAAAVVVAIAAPRTGRLPALALAAAVGLTPWLPRQLLWTHYDGFATVQLLVAAWLLLGDPAPRRRVAAGIALGLVVNANLMYVVLVVTCLAAHLLASSGSARFRLRALGDIVIGTIAVEAVLSVVVRTLAGSGPWFAEWVAIRTALILVGDDTWFTPLATAIESNPMLAVLLVVGPVALLAARRRAHAVGVDAARFGGAWLVGALVIILVLHALTSSSWLGGSFYVVVLLPPAVVALVGVTERLRGPGPDPASVGTPGGLAGKVLLVLWVAVLGLLWRDGVLRPGALSVAFLALGAVALTVARGTAAGLRGRVVAAALVPAILLATWSAPAQVPGTDGFTDLAAREQKEWTLFHAIVAVKEMVVATVPTERDLVFWHRVNGREGEWLRQINMTYYGGGTGRLHSDRGADPFGMPELREEQLIALGERRPISVVLIGLDRAELTAGLVALATAVPDATTVAQRIIEGDTFDLHVAVVEIG